MSTQNKKLSLKDSMNHKKLTFISDFKKEEILN